MAITLLEHRQNLKNNKDVYIYDIYIDESSRIIKTLTPHLKKWDTV